MKPYKAGQVWTYRTRAGDENSTLTILHIEESVASYGAIAWVRIDGLRVRAPSAPGGVLSTVSRAPFTASALDASVLQLCHEAAPETPDLEFYAQRRAAIEAYDEGAYNTAVSDAIRSLQRLHNEQP